MSDLYEADFFGWANLQAKLLREGRVTEADLDHIAEEIEDLGGNRRQELRNRLAVLLLHLLKWQYQPGLRSRSWKLTIEEQRDRITEHLDENPSLRPMLPAAVERGYHYALLRAEKETGLSRTSFPAACLYTPGQVTDAAFLPGEP